MGFLHQPNVTVNRSGERYNSTLWIRTISDTVNADFALKINVRFVKIDQANNLRGLTRSSDLPLPTIVPWGVEWSGAAGSSRSCSFSPGTGTTDSS